MSILPISQVARFPENVTLHVTIEIRESVAFLVDQGQFGVYNWAEPVYLIILVAPKKMIFRVVQSHFEKTCVLMHVIQLNFNFSHVVDG